MVFERLRWILVSSILLPAIFLLPLSNSGLFVHAQTDETEEPDSGPRIHVVTEGENLTAIAEQYDVTVDQLQLVNHLRIDDILAIGAELVIPGGDKYPAITIYRARPGNSLQSIAAGFDIALDDVLATNRSLNREYVPAVGQPMALMIGNDRSELEAVTGIPHVVQDGETILELAAQYGVPVSHLIYVNNLPYPVKLYPGERLRIPADKSFNDFPGEWTSIEIKPETIKQGDTVTIFVDNLLDGQPTGMFLDQELRFTEWGDGYVSLVGVDAFTPAGHYPVVLGGAGDRPWYPFEQKVAISDSNFPGQTITVSEELSDLLDPSVRSEEDAFLSSIYNNFTEEKKWDGLFQVPVTDTLVTAPYGGGRSYNEGPVTIFHTGTDFNGNIGTPILAAADGTVVFNDDLDLRGKTVIVDHGWGVMTAYNHLSESFVQTGQGVNVGQPIGAGGSTGLSTGPHLHWELRIKGVPIDGMQWTTNEFP